MLERQVRLDLFFFKDEKITISSSRKEATCVHWLQQLQDFVYEKRIRAARILPFVDMENLVIGSYWGTNVTS